MAQALTVKTIAKLTTPGRYRDAEVRGLYLQVINDRNRSWILRYEVCGKERQMGLGPLSLVGLKEARERARAARMKLLDGIDPLAEKRERKAAQAVAAQLLTFEQAARAWHQEHAAKWTNSKVRAQVLQKLADYAFPVIGKIAVKDVATPDVLRVLEPIWQKIPVSAARLRSHMEAVIAWATVKGHRAGDNPARWRGHLREALPAHQRIAPVKHHEALSYEQIPQFMAALAKQEGVAPRALEFLILTAARSGEVRLATWEEIDLGQRLWTIPAERMKAGQAHAIPLTDTAVALLGALPREDGNPYVFIGARKGGAMWHGAIAGVMAAVERDETIHGFRSTFRDWAGNETHHAREVCEAALAHTVGNKVERAYRRSDALAKRRALMEDWTDYCGGKRRKGKVIAFR